MEIHDVEQGTEEWFSLRAGLPTASEFSKLVTSTGAESKSLEDYAIYKALELLAGEPLETWEGNQWTDRGTLMESEARDWFSVVHDQVEQVGFVTNHDAGCSPDGFVGHNALLEIKCLSPAKHGKVLLYHLKHGKAPSLYRAQAQGQAWICEREVTYQLFYHPHPKIPNLVVENKLDFYFVAKLTRAVQECLRIRDETLDKLRGM